MKYVLLMLLVVSVAGLSQAPRAEEQKHLLVPPPAGVVGGITVSARSIEREATYPSVIQLRGQVEIKGYKVMVRADEADYHAATSEIEARGNVRVKLGNDDGAKP